MNKQHNRAALRRHTPGPWTIEADRDWEGVGRRHALHDNRHVVAHSGIICDLRDQPSQAADARLIAAAPDLLHALKWAAEYVSLYNGDGAGWTGVQQGHDRDRFIDDDTGNVDGEALRAFLEQVIASTEDNA